MKKKRTYILILLSLILTDCQESREKATKDFIKSFVDNILIKKNKNTNDWNDYIAFDKNLSLDKKETLVEIVNQQISNLNSILIENNNEYSIISHYELDDHSLTTNLKYEDFSKVYFIICSNKILTPVIVENDRIISFFYGITKHKRNSYPWILNKKDVTN